VIDESSAGCMVIDSGLTKSGIAKDVWDSDTTSFSTGSIGEMVKKIYALCKNIFSVSA